MKKNEQTLNDTLRSEGGSILVVDDNSMLRKLLCRGLDRWGYSVLQAEDGCEALACLQYRAHPIDLLVTDINMPGMDGVELSKQARKILPDLPILVISSNFSESVMAFLSNSADVHKLEKPFELEKLCEKLFEILPFPC
jgi:two-component system cell cycle sensor histidine kinase/response regulator CckA